MSAPSPLAALTRLTDVLAGRVEPSPFDDPAWPAILDLAAVHSLLPTLWLAVRARSPLESMPPAAVDAIDAHLPEGVSSPDLVLHRAYVANSERNAMLLEEGNTVLATLRAAGVDVLPIKGLHGLLSGWWADPASRVMVDLDVLIRPEQGAQAQEALRALGYAFDPETSGELADHELPGLRRDERWTLELHTALVMHRFVRVLPPEEIWRDAEDGGAGPMLRDSDAVTVSIAHGELQDFMYPLGLVPLRSLVDVRDRCRPGTPPVDWGAVRARFHGAGRGHVLAAHLLMARRLLGADVPTTRSPRAAAHLRRVTAEVSHPWLRELARYWTYLPITYGPERMAAEYGAASPLWRSRIRHATGSVTRRVRHP